MADTVFNFGMHSGKSFQHVLDNDKWYVAWAFKQDKAGSIKCKTGLLKRFVEFCKAAETGKGVASDASTCAGSLPGTPWSQQATQSDYPTAPKYQMGEYTTVPKHQMGGNPMMAPTPMTMMHQQHFAPSQAALAPCPQQGREADQWPNSDPSWQQVLDHLEERNIDFEAVRDAHRDTRRDILKAVFYGDPILRAQAETIWLKLAQEKQGKGRERSRSRGKKLKFVPCTISTGFAPSISAAF
uniref:Uncharacterized protein n=1 Tax=Alexandrium monilatum TaxID=311494 RepID=A0A7S4TAA3_9DINO